MPRRQRGVGDEQVPVAAGPAVRVTTQEVEPTLTVTLSPSVIEMASPLPGVTVTVKTTADSLP